ncbi:hypothetical protein [uncultured Mameliella sp.]|uniref:hypothetical protein n=1 Tax=uncultured Mameliella sp. TaxID=1447087 RepID=UPI00262A46FE|nr:hypothetical protein [uncultured Mameliella sp.]
MAGLTSPLLKLRTAAVLRLFEARAYRADRKGPEASQGKKNVLIFGQGRSGTTLFEQLMVSTGHFTGRHEVLNTVTREVIRPTPFVRGLGRLTPGENVILHIKPEHLGRARRKRGPVDARAFLEEMIADGWTLVHIQRRDVLRQMISKYVAKARGAYHKTDDAEVEIRLDVPEAEFIAEYERRRGLLVQEDSLLAGLPRLSLSYEEHLEDPHLHQQTVDRVLAELGLPARPVSTRLKKIGKGSPARFLSNAEALRASFATRGWEWTL